MDIFFEIYKDLPQEGPGTNQSTIEALSSIPDLPKNPRVLDVGCGSGRQTLVLARETQGKIIALDNHQPYLDKLKQRAKSEGLLDIIRVENCSMSKLDFQKQYFDLIWAEGAIYSMGFREGLKSWKRFLRQNGFLAVTELSWLKENPPPEVKEFWKSEYPRMKTIKENLKTIKESGYILIKHFTLPKSAWWDNFYIPLEKRIGKLRGKYADNKDALKVLEKEQREIDLYRRYSDYYGYVFYIVKKGK